MANGIKFKWWVYTMFNTLAIMAALCFIFTQVGCVKSVDPEIKSPVNIYLSWDTKWPCIQNQVIGQYIGQLEVVGLEEGEHFQVIYGDSMIWDSVASSNSHENITIHEYSAYIQNIRINYRNETHKLESIDSMATNRFGPGAFPSAFTVTGDGSVQGFSLLEHNNSLKRLRCIISDTNVSYNILPDTLWTNERQIKVEMIGDYYDNVYDIRGEYIDSMGETRRFFKYLDFSSSNSGRKQLIRQKFTLHEEIPNFPAWIEFHLWPFVGHYEIRIERKRSNQSIEVPIVSQ